jgi:general transcription factor 3C polypeptide 3 (transcription factor C subunit 4)
MDDVGQSQSLVWTYLYRQAADHLYEQELYEDASFFYQQLREIPELVDSSLLVQLGKCYLQGDDKQQAQDCFHLAAELDENDTVARMELAKLYEETHKPDLAFNCIAEVMLLRAQKGSPGSKKKRRKSQKQTKQGAQQGSENVSDNDEPDPEPSRALFLEAQYLTLCTEHAGLRAGGHESTVAWLKAAKALTDDFRSFKPFYPWDKYLKFLGYSNETTGEVGVALDSDVSAMAERLTKGIWCDSQHFSGADRGRFGWRHIGEKKCLQHRNPC